MESGDIAWVLVSAALVLFMTPGLAFFYGGMDRSRSVLNMLMMNFWCLLTIPILWVIVGYSIAAGDFDASWFGGFDAAFLSNVDIADGGWDAVDDRLPGHVRGDHAGADLGCGRGPHEVHGVGDLRSRVDAAGVRTGVQVGCTAAGWVCVARSTSPVVPRST
jgi:hypothetical protein